MHRLDTISGYYTVNSLFLSVRALIFFYAYSLRCYWIAMADRIWVITTKERILRYLRAENMNQQIPIAKNELYPLVDVEPNYACFIAIKEMTYHVIRGNNNKRSVVLTHGAKFFFNFKRHSRFSNWYFFCWALYVCELIVYCCQKSRQYIGWNIHKCFRRLKTKKEMSYFWIGWLIDSFLAGKPINWSSFAPHINSCSFAVDNGNFINDLTIMVIRRLLQLAWLLNKLNFQGFFRSHFLVFFLCEYWSA